MRFLSNKKSLYFFLFLVLPLACKQPIGGADGKGGKIDVTINYKGGEPLAKIGGITLSVEALNEDFTGRQGTFKGASHLNTEQKKIEFVENQVVQEALFLEAVKEGYFNDLETIRDIKKILVQRLMRDKLNKEENTTPATQEEIKEYYDKNPNLFNRKEAVKVSFLEIPINNDKNKAQKLAQEIYKDAVKEVKNANNNMLSQVAMKHVRNSKDNMTTVQVQMSNFLEKDAFEAKFGKDTFEMVKKIEEPGQFAPLSHNENSFFVIMKAGARKELNETLEEAKPKIEKRLGYENRSKNYEKYVKGLHEKYKITIDKEKIGQLGKIVSDAKAENKPNLPPQTP